MNNLINNRKATVESLNQKKETLQNDMANPKDINQNAKEIEEVKHEINLLEAAKGLGQELGIEQSDFKEIIEATIAEMAESWEDISGNQKAQDNLEKDMEILGDILDKSIEGSSSQDPYIPADDSFSGFDEF